MAASIDPSNACFALGVVHGHEILGDYAQALSAAKAFYARNLSGGVGKRGAKNRLAFFAGVLVFNYPINIYEVYTKYIYIYIKRKIRGVSTFVLVECHPT